MSEFITMKTNKKISVKEAVLLWSQREKSIENLNFQRIAFVMENDKIREDYLKCTSGMLKWIESATKKLDERAFSNSLLGVQQQWLQLANYRTIEKPPKFVEKSNLEVLLWTLQSNMRANNQKPYIPMEGKRISDLNKAWERLEKIEHERELALREELIRQEMLEKLAARFSWKASMRETWLYEQATFEAEYNKQKAIEIDAYAYEERIYGLINLCDVLQAEGYHDMDRITARKDNILRLYCHLLELLRVKGKWRNNYQELLEFRHMVEDVR